jgi:hypothetical protein
VPGLTGVKQCNASGQQYDVAGQTAVGAQASPTTTHSFVSGQQTSEAEQASGSVAQVLFATGVKQCFASGQQY